MVAKWKVNWENNYLFYRSTKLLESFTFFLHYKSTLTSDKNVMVIIHLQKYVSTVLLIVYCQQYFYSQQQGLALLDAIKAENDDLASVCKSNRTYMYLIF